MVALKSVSCYLSLSLTLSLSLSLDNFLCQNVYAVVLDDLSH